MAALFGCSKSDSNPEIYFGEGEGISCRTSNNMRIGPQDPTDWTSDATWSERERNLFPELSFNLNGPQQPALIAYTSAYSNPAQVSIASWTFQINRTSSGGPANYIGRAVIVNRKYEILTKLGPNDFTLGQQYMLDYARIGMQPNELYRLYSVVYDASGLVYKGHGDVRYSR
jgi:hypothetical protein